MLPRLRILKEDEIVKELRASLYLVDTFALNPIPYFYFTILASQQDVWAIWASLRELFLCDAIHELNSHNKYLFVMCLADFSQ